jgi:hypothetical protein
MGTGRAFAYICNRIRSALGCERALCWVISPVGVNAVVSVKSKSAITTSLSMPSVENFFHLAANASVGSRASFELERAKSAPSRTGVPHEHHRPWTAKRVTAIVVDLDLHLVFRSILTCVCSNSRYCPSTKCDARSGGEAALAQQAMHPPPPMLRADQSTFEE